MQKGGVTGTKLKYLYNKHNVLVSYRQSKADEHNSRARMSKLKYKTSTSPDGQEDDEDEGNLTTVFLFGCYDQR